MPYFLVGIRGDPARGAGLLAKAGIQNVVHLDDAPRTLTARLSAADGESAVQRVRSALEGEAFTIKGDARPELE
ncbi:MAG: hypothetical protein AABM42_02335 [Actinomycetota bacterium]